MQARNTAGILGLRIFWKKAQQIGCSASHMRQLSSEGLPCAANRGGLEDGLEPDGGKENRKLKQAGLSRQALAELPCSYLPICRSPLVLEPGLWFLQHDGLV